MLKIKAKKFKIEGDSLLIQSGDLIDIETGYHSDDESEKILRCLNLNELFSAVSKKLNKDTLGDDFERISEAIRNVHIGINLKERK